MNILNLPDWTINDVNETVDSYKITATYDVVPSGCPHCGFMLKYRHGTISKLFADTPIHGKQVAILAIRERYICQNCGKSYIQPLPDVDDRHYMTKRLMRYIEREVFNRTFTALAKDIGVHEKTIRNVFHQHMVLADKNRHVITPRWLGIDELKIAGGYRGVFTDVKEKRILDIINNRKKTVVGKYLSNLPDKQRVEIVCMDMWEPYKDLMRAILPKAQVVVDKFHFLRMVSDALDSVRKSIRESLTQKQRRQLMRDRFVLLKRKRDLDEKDLLVLSTWLSNFAVLKETYERKEELYDIWECNSRQDAEHLYDEWQTRIPGDALFAFRPLLIAMQNWRQEIFAYFDSGATNAYTESMNGLIKLANRMGRGYSFDVVRARILFAPDSKKANLFRQGIFENQSGLMQFPHGGDVSEIFHGVDISTLVREIESGHFLPISTGNSE